MLPSKSILKALIKILLAIISAPVYILQSRSSVLLFRQPSLVLKETLLPLGDAETPWTYFCSGSSSVVLLSRASFLSTLPTLVYLDVAALNIYAEIHYLSIKYL